MIPTIETIIEELLKGDITKQKAITWLNQHAENAHADLRDNFAGLAMQGMMVDVERPVVDYISATSYKMADAMMEARLK